MAETQPLQYEPLISVRATSHQSDIALADCKGKRIGILIVTFNAVSTLTKVLKRIPPEVWANVEEIAVFDDASQDSTYELAVGLKTMRDLPKLTLLRNEKNLGYGGNQKAGYKYFLAKGFDVVVLLHGDGQYAPEMLAHLYHPLVAGEAEAVFGSRMMKTYGGARKGGMPLYKYVGNRILTVFENRSLGMRLTEFHSGYRAYSLHALKHIDFTHMTDDFHFDTEIIIKLHHQRYRIHEVPIPTYYGDEICYVNGMRYARDVYRAVQRYRKTTRSVACHPEFREYFVHYPIKKSKYSSHFYAMSMVGANQAVLDLGCGEGFFARELKKNGNEVTGVDVLRKEVPPEGLADYHSADLDAGITHLIPLLKERRFSRILLLDVLEHLRRPEELLSQCSQLMQPESELIISLPNVANITVRLQLLFGLFNYTERGILDKTHLRFFTRRTARQLIKDAGFRIALERTTVMPIELLLDVSPDNPVMKFLNGILKLATSLMPGLLGYQLMYCARLERK